MRWTAHTALVLVLVAAGPAAAVFLPGEGRGRNECWIGLSVEGEKPLEVRRSGRRTVVVQEACAGACDFTGEVCLNNPGCDPARLIDVHILGDILLNRPKAARPQATCSSPRVAPLDLRHGRTSRLKFLLFARADPPAHGRDVDAITFVCRPAPAGDSCARCGDGVVQEGEECDDKNRFDGDGCDGNCTRTRCGNHIRTAGERCDDGNLVDGDGCDRNCTPTACGNGIVTTKTGEECDPPGPISATIVCSQSCQREAIGPCTCPSPPARLVVGTRAPTGTCGEALQDSGAPFRSLTCGGLYLGGGDATVQQPIPVPEGTEAAFGVTCSGNRFTLGQTTAETAGAPNRCTAAGCRFGPPLAAPNTLSASLSTCIINTISRAVGGEAECDTGRIELSVPLIAQVFLTGEDQAPGDPGLQACPVCIDGRCRGGANAGGTCTPYAPTISTSFDCPPAGQPLDELSLELRFSTDTITWTAVPSGTQSQVFCGYCRDADLTLAFADPPVACLTGNRAATTTCGGQFESCEQRQQGAFGPNGSSVATIRLQGAPAGPLAVGTPADATLASVFCVPPVAGDIVNNNVSLPGPAALTLPIVVTPE